MTNFPRRGVGPVSLGEVAAKAGVSISTVSRIVNGETRRASPETLARVQEAIKAVGYHPNQLGRALRNRESRLVAMLAANLDNPVMATIAASTEAALREAGYTMILCDTHDRPDLQDDYLNAMRSQVVQVHPAQPRPAGLCGAWRADGVCEPAQPVRRMCVCGARQPGCRCGRSRLPAGPGHRGTSGGVSVAGLVHHT